MRKFVVYPGNNPDVIRDALLKRGNWEQIPESAKDAINNANFIWRPWNYGLEGYSKLDDVQRKNKELVQVFNHFPDNTGLCTKTGLIKSLKQYNAGHEEARNLLTVFYWLMRNNGIGAAKYCVWDTIPTSFIIAAGLEDTEYHNFITRVKDLSKKDYQKESVPAKHCMENMWLIKPANLNQGRGIEVFRTLQGMLCFLALKPTHTQWVIQKYIEKPLLYYNRKFDIRVWVLVTNKNEVFMYKHGYMRTSSSSYNARDQNNFVHLTNNCLQKNDTNYGAYEEGNTLSYQILQDYLRQQYPDYNINLETQIISRFKDFIIDSYLAWKANLIPTKRRTVFELFGYDFLIDEDLRVWLIEVNTNPYLGVPNPFIADLLPKMVDDMFEIVLDPIFPPKNPPRQDGRPNDFELIYSESGATHSSKPINLRSSFRASPYPVQKFETATQMMNFPPQKEIKSIFGNGASSFTKKITSVSADLTNYKISANPEKLSLEAIIKNMQSPFLFRSELDSHFLNMQVKTVLSSLREWKNLNANKIGLACRALTTISNSPAIILLAEPKKFLILSDLLSDREVTVEIKLAIIETLNNLIKDLSIKKNIMCNKIIHDLINITILSCDEHECKMEPLELRMSMLNCLINLGSLNVKKSYVPGENYEREKMRNFFISQGGLIALVILSRYAIEEDVRSAAQKALNLSVDDFDWEKQASVLILLWETQEKEKRKMITNFVRGPPPSQLLSERKSQPLSGEQRRNFHTAIHTLEEDKISVLPISKPTMLLKNSETFNTDPPQELKIPPSSIDTCFFYRSHDASTTKTKKTNGSISFPL